MSGDVSKALDEFVTERSARKDSTLQSIDELTPILEYLTENRESIGVIAAIGSGEGTFAAFLGELLDAAEVHAIDVDEESLRLANNKGLKTHVVDVERNPLPLADGSVDLIVSLGLFEHLTWYDGLLEEFKRVLSTVGLALFALPNMAGWTNRLSLLTGHQPRNVEFSKRKSFGIMDAYGTARTVGHVHTATVGALEEYLEYHDFDIIDTVGLHPYQEGRLVPLVDKLVSRRPSLCRRFAVLGQYQPDR